MAPDTLERTRLDLSAAALSEWNGHVESVLRGMAHALNNRAAALSAVRELTGSAEDSLVIAPLLGTELERMQELVAVVRSLSAPRTGSDAFAPADAAAEAAAILRLHVEHRDHRVVIDARGAPPVRLERWMFVRALIALGAAASPKEAPNVGVSGSGEWVVARLNGEGAATLQATSYVSELAAAMGGGPLRPDEGCGFRVPTLAALRQREGRGA
jgi:hypothetical protein